jgi:hypothetical protein
MRRCIHGAGGGVPLRHATPSPLMQLGATYLLPGLAPVPYSSSSNGPEATWPASSLLACFLQYTPRPRHARHMLLPECPREPLFGPGLGL